MKAAMADPTFTLEHCKRMWKYLTVHMAGLMGEVDPPKCPAPWLNLPKLWRFCQDIVDSLDTVKTKEEFADLIWSWTNCHRLYVVFSCVSVAPWKTVSAGGEEGR
jgi:hypothetical protein